MSYILFICQWNIGRSQIAQWLYNTIYWEHNIKALSAGIDDVGYNYNYKPYPPIVSLMKEKYIIDISGQEVTHCTEKHIKDAYKVYVLCKKEECINKSYPDFFKWDHIHYIPIWDPQHRWESQLIEIIKEIEWIIKNIDLY